MVICLYGEVLRNLIVVAQSGDNSAFSQLYLHCKPQLTRYFQHRCRCQAVIDDFEQEVMIKLITRLITLKSPDHFWPWIFRIANNCMVDYYRKDSRAAMAHQSIPDDHYLTMIEGNQNDQPLSRLDQIERVNLIRHGISKLSDMYQMVINQRCIMNRSYAEVAQLINCSEAAARTYVCRARKALELSLN